MLNDQHSTAEKRPRGSEPEEKSHQNIGIKTKKRTQGGTQNRSPRERREGK